MSSSRISALALAKRSIRDFERLSPINYRIYCSITGLKATGPHKDKPDM